MTLKQVRFTFQHDGCPLADCTRHVAGVSLLVSGLYHSGNSVHANVLVHFSDVEAEKRLVQEWKRNPRVHKILPIHEGKRTSRYHLSYEPKKTILPLLLDHSPVSIGPAAVQNGIETWSIVGESKPLEALLADLAREGTVIILALREFDEFQQAPGERPDEGRLTSNELECLVMAYENGYYRNPRDETPSRLAARMKLPPSTFLRTLRAAEQKVLQGYLSEMDRRDANRLNAIRHHLQTLPKGRDP